MSHPDSPVVGTRPGGGNIVPVRHQVTVDERTARAGHADAGTVCITVFISPYRADRARAAAGDR